MLTPFLKEYNIKLGGDGLFSLLMHENVLIKNHKRRVRTTMSYHRFHKWPNLIKEYIPQQPMELYVSDILIGELILGMYT